MSDFERVQRILSLVQVEVGAVQPKAADPACHCLLKQAAASARLYKDSDNAEVSQWLSLARGLCEGTDKKSTLLEQVNSSLQSSSFLLPTAASFGLADLAVFDAVQQPKVASECLAFPQVCRWARQMSAALGVPVAFNLPPFAPTVFDVATTSTASSSKGEEQKKESKKGGAEESKQVKEIPPMSEKQLAKQKEKAAKKEKSAQKEKTEEPKAAGDDLDPSKLDFRVGQVQKCWPHPEAEKLLW